MEEFTKLNDFEKESNKKRSKKEPAIDIDLGADTCFDILVLSNNVTRVLCVLLSIM